MNVSTSPSTAATATTTANTLKPATLMWQRPLLWVLLAVIFATIIGLPELAAPISGDTAIYAYIGRAIAHGQVLYRDVWDFKVPGIYYFFALLFRFLPDSLLTLRLAALAFILMGVFGSWLLFRRFFTLTTTVILTAFVAIWTQLSGVLNGDGPYPETFIFPLMVLAYISWFEYKRSQRWLWLFGCGLTVGALALFKQTSIVTLGGMVLVLIIEWVMRLVPRRQTASGLAALSVGVALVIVPWFFYFEANHASTDMISAVVGYPALYARTTPLSEALVNALNMIRDLASSLGLLYVLVPMGIWVYWTQYKGQGRLAYLRSPFFAVVIWAILEMISVSAPLRFYDRYWLQPLPALLLLAGLGLDLLVKASGSPGAYYRRPLLIALISLLIVATATTLPRALTNTNHRLLSVQITRAEAIAAYLNIHSRPADTIFAWGDNRIPYVSGHASGVKWINTEPFQTSAIYSTNPAVVNELLHELQTNPPRYFIEASVYKNLSASYLAGSTVDQFIQQHYHLIAQIQDAQIYEYQ